VGSGQGLSYGATAEQMVATSAAIALASATLTFFDLQASSAPLFLQVEPVELV
jgi:hypothetical protein